MVDHSKYDCMETRAIYRITCRRCTLGGREGGSYIGQSGRSLHARQAEHGAGVTNNSSTCPLVRHSEDHHPDDRLSPTDFMMSKLISCRDNMTRLVGEGEAIANQEAAGDLLWNSKGEYGRSKVIRWKPTVVQV